ncbi:hypothetical protein ACVMAJ_006897 [Bradyrhizobium sp. USDA 4448]
MIYLATVFVVTATIGLSATIVLPALYVWVEEA